MPPLGVGVDWRSVDTECYSHLVFVCGPFADGPNVMRLLDRFACCRLVGVNLSMLVPLDQWNPFDLLLERDSSADARPDITFLSRGKRVPVVGLILVEPHEGALDHVANEAIDRLIQSREVVTVPIDTRLDTNSTGLRSAAEVESLIARMDLVITTRLHAQHIGHPVAGDDKYGDASANRRLREQVGLKRMFLHASTLEFALDAGKTPYLLNAPLASELVDVLDRLA